MLGECDVYVAKYVQAHRERYTMAAANAILAKHADYLSRCVGRVEWAGTLIS